MLDVRKSAILAALVEAYIDTAQPVGSRSLVSELFERVSSATVRSEMAHLEEEGYLFQPHTSSGRIPTDKAYRFFVDNFVNPINLNPVEQQQVQEFFKETHNELDLLLRETSNFLASMTGSAGVVSSPNNGDQIIKSVQLVGLGRNQVLLVVVTENGSIEKCVLEFILPSENSEVLLMDATESLASGLIDHRLGFLPNLPPTGNFIVDEVLTQALSALRELSLAEETTYVTGVSAIAEAFEEPDQVCRVLSFLEHQFFVTGLIRNLEDRGLRVAIGTETGVEPLFNCSIVAAPYEIGGKQVGSVGVLGSTRMDYSQVLALVAVVGHRLGECLSGN